MTRARVEEGAKAESCPEGKETATNRVTAHLIARQQPAVSNLGTGTCGSFNLENERERKRRLNAVWGRTKEEEREEERVRRELRLVEAQIRKLKKSGSSFLVAPVRSQAASPEAMVANSRAVLDQCFRSSFPLPKPGASYLQSARLATPAAGGPMGLNKTLIKKMDMVLKELEVTERPVMPTKRVCDMYDHVRKSILMMLTLQKIAQKKEGEVISKRAKLNKLTGGTLPLDKKYLKTSHSPPAPKSSAAIAAAALAAATSKSKPVRGKKKIAAAAKDPSADLDPVANAKAEDVAKPPASRKSSKRKPKKGAGAPASATQALATAAAAAVASVDCDAAATAAAVASVFN